MYDADILGVVGFDVVQDIGYQVRPVSPLQK